MQWCSYDPLHHQSHHISEGQAWSSARGHTSRIALYGLGPHEFLLMRHASVPYIISINIYFLPLNVEHLNEV